MRIDAYIFREWIKIFALAVVAILGLLLLSEIYNELPRFIERKAPPETVVSFFLLLVPGYLPSLLPVCFLLSLLHCLATLQRNGEIVAIRAAGIGLFRLSRAFWIAATLLAGMLLWLNASLAPGSLEEAEAIKEQVKERDLDANARVVRGTMEKLGVYLPDSDELWFAEVYRASTDEALGVTVSRPDPEGGRIRHEAARARFDPETSVWTLEEGKLLRIASGGGLPDQLEPYETFELTGSGMTPEILLGLSRRPKDLSLRQLDGLIRRLGDDPRATPYRTRHLSILATPLQFFVVVLVALPCALGTGRSRSAGGFFQAIWLYLVFFALTVLFAAAGQRGWIPPAAAAWTPFLLAGAGGLWLYRRNA
ncbi:MAG: LptF/LptG family permease [Puniceicoccaceae bacterium]